MKYICYLVCLIFFLTSTAYSFNSYGDNYQFDVITKTGDIVFADNHQNQRRLIDIKRFPSINENKTIAFVGKTEGDNGTKQQNIYAVRYEKNPDSTITVEPPEALMLTVFELKDEGDAPTQIFGYIQINNQNQVIAYRLTYATVNMPYSGYMTMPLSYVEKWDADIQNLPLEATPVELVAGGDAGIGSVFSLLLPIVPLTIFEYPSSFVELSPWDAIFNRLSMNNNGESAFVAMDANKLFMAAPTVPPYVYDYIEIDELPSLRIADTGEVLFGQNINGVQEIRVSEYNYINTTETIVSTEEKNFTKLGINAAISDNGHYIAFYGDLNEAGSKKYETTSGQGIFVYFRGDIIYVRGDKGTFRYFRRLFRVNGISNNDLLDPGELYLDKNRNGKFDKGENDESGIMNFYPDENICVNDAGYIVYFAQNEKGEKAIFRSKINLNSVQYKTSDPTEIISVGDSITGLQGTVQNLSIFDSLSNEGQPGDLLFWAEMSDGTCALVLGRVIVNPLIFIPGIAASNLRTPDAFIRDDVWPTIVGDDINFLTLDPNDQHHNIIAIDATRDFSPIGIGYDKSVVYGTLLEMLTYKGGFREYDINDDPTRRTLSGWDIEQKENNPSLFVFAYDWRRSNAEAADQLREYISGIYRFYPSTTKINIIAHSMGGLVAKRYILDNPQHNIDKMITIGTPFLGAPKAIVTMENGFFYDILPLDWFNGDNIKRVVEFFPGLHHLLPSKAYFDLGGRPFIERGWDINKNGINNEIYNYNDLIYLLNNRYRSNPGTECNNFHSSSQDDWRQDISGIKYLHIVGNQSESQTIGTVIATQQIIVKRNDLGLYIGVDRYNIFRRNYTEGDKVQLEKT